MIHEPLDPQRVRRVELFISNLLRTGVIVSLVLVCVGMTISIARHRQAMSDPKQLHTLIESAAGTPSSLGDVFTGLAKFKGRAVISLGLLLLIATPVMRVAASIVGFVYERDRTFVVITSVVLALLLLSFALGRAGG